MRYYDIETFLAIVSQGSVSKAANYMFVAQSTVSQRLQKLENELGGPLLIRKQGINGVELTPKGEQFLQVAEKLLNIWRETDTMVEEEPATPLVIGGLESLITLALPSLFTMIMEADANIRLQIITRNSDTLFNLMEQRKLDAAFLVRDLNVPRVTCEPIVREKIMLVCRKGLLPADRPADITDLDIRNEVFFSWNPEFRAWHNSQWKAGVKPFLMVDITSMLLYFMKDDRFWTLCPTSVAKHLVENRNMEAHEVKNNPPDRVIYLLKHSAPMPERMNGIRLLEDCLEKYLSNPPF